MGGYLRVRIRGSAPELFINLCAARGIELWDVRWQGEDLYASMKTPAFFRLRPLARESRVRVRIAGRYGTAFALRRLGRRPLALLLAPALVMGVYILSTFIWSVEIDSAPEQATREELVQVAADLGLRPKAWKWKLDRREIERQMVLKIPSLAWVSIDFAGTKAIISVAEKTPPPPEPASGAAHIVADKAGVIVDVLVLSGESRVEPGDVVRPGDVLISGLITAPDPSPDFPLPGEEPEEPSLFQWLRAKGRVVAQTWYEAYVEVPLAETLSVRTGREAVQRVLHLGDRDFHMGGPRTPPYDQFEEDRYYRELEVAGFTLPRLGWTALTYYEVDHHVRRMPPDEAARAGMRRLERDIMEEIPLTARIIRSDGAIVRMSDGMVGVRLLVECHEEIGVFAPPSEEELAQWPETTPVP